MTDVEPPDLPRGPPPGPRTPDADRFDTLASAPTRPPATPMNPILKGCLIAILIPSILVFLLVSACFTIALFQ